jgi:hypothetical protein
MCTHRIAGVFCGIFEASLPCIVHLEPVKKIWGNYLYRGIVHIVLSAGNFLTYIGIVAGAVYLLLGLLYAWSWLRNEKANEQRDVNEFKYENLGSLGESAKSLLNKGEGEGDDGEEEII